MIFVPRIIVLCDLIEFTTSDAHCGTMKHFLQVSLMNTKFDIKKFFVNNEFGLWKVKMEEILIQQNV